MNKLKKGDLFIVVNDAMDSSLNGSIYIALGETLEGSNFDVQAKLVYRKNDGATENNVFRRSEVQLLSEYEKILVLGLTGNN